MWTTINLNLFSLMIVTISFYSTKNHIMSCLISIEILNISVIIFLINSSPSNMSLTVMYLIITVAEAAMGLTILASSIREYSGDTFSVTNSLW